MAEVSSIITIRLSWFGSMKKINWELLACKMVQISKLSLIDCAEPALTLNRLLSSHSMKNSVISHHAQLILVLLLELQFILNFQNLVKERKSSKPLQTNISFKLEVLTVSILRLTITFMTFQIEEDWEEVQ